MGRNCTVCTIVYCGDISPTKTVEWCSDPAVILFFLCVFFFVFIHYKTVMMHHISVSSLHIYLTAPNQDFGMGSLYDLLLGPPPHPSSYVRHPNNVCLDVRNCFQLLLRVLLSVMFIVTSWPALSAWDFEYLSKTGLSRLTSGNLLKYLQFGIANQNLDLLL